MQGRPRKSRKNEDVERKKTGPLERVEENHEERERRPGLAKGGSREGEMGHGEDLEEVDPGLGEL